MTWYTLSGGWPRLFGGSRRRSNGKRRGGADDYVLTTTSKKRAQCIKQQARRQRSARLAFGCGCSRCMARLDPTSRAALPGMFGPVRIDGGISDRPGFTAIASEG